METQQIQWAQKAVRDLIKIDRRYQQAIKHKINRLIDFPQVRLDIKHLHDASYRLRHGDYRIFFEVIDGVPKIIRIQKIVRRSSRTYR